MSEYILIQEFRLGPFIGMVQDMINKGCEPLGGISVVLHPSGERTYYQAMVSRAATPLPEEPKAGEDKE